MQTEGLVTSKVIFALSLAAMLLACAHDKAGESARSEGTSVAQGAEKPHESAAARRAEQAEERAARSEEHERSVPNEHREPASADTRPNREPDNSAVNESERKGASTAMDQGNGELDIKLTQSIRKALMADDTLSFTAKNAKIITNEGHVTLRGPVKTAAEKEAIYKKAVSAAGRGRVTNELEIDGD